MIGSFASEKKCYEADKSVITLDWSEKPLWRAVFRPFKEGDPVVRSAANAVLRVHGRGSFLTENLLRKSEGPDLEASGSPISLSDEAYRSLVRECEQNISEWEIHVAGLEAKECLSIEESSSLALQLKGLKNKITREGNIKKGLDVVHEAQRLLTLVKARPACCVLLHTSTQEGLTESEKSRVLAWLKQAVPAMPLDRLLIQAPIEAWDEGEGKPVPLPGDIAKEFDKNKGLVPPDHLLAWRALILSWNSAFPRQRVDVKQKSTPAVPSSDPQVASLLTVIEQQALTIQRLEAQISRLAALVEGKSAPVSALVQETVRETLPVGIPQVRPETGVEARKNPAKPRSDSLSAEVREQLRLFFGLEDLPPKEVFASLDKEAKKEVSKRTSLPHWAVTGYNLYGQKFLSACLTKQVDGKSFNEWCKGRPADAKTPAAGKTAYSRLQQKWKSVKDANKGVPLVNNPSSAAERRLYNAYLRIRDKFLQLRRDDNGFQPFLPSVGRKLSLRGSSPSKGQRRLASLLNE